MKLIGDDRREATDWIQDRLLITRPEAERAMIGLLAEKVAITTDKGIFLTEDEEEAEVKGKKFSQRIKNRRIGRQMMAKNIQKLGKQFGNKVPPKKKDDPSKDDFPTGG